MTCAAIQQSDEMFCNKCDLRWDVNDPEPPRCLSHSAQVVLKQQSNRAMELKQALYNCRKQHPDFYIPPHNTSTEGTSPNN